MNSDSKVDLEESSFNYERISSFSSDQGVTSLLFGRQIWKSDQRIEILGEIDVLNSSIGLCKAHTKCTEIMSFLIKIQKQLMKLATEMSVTEIDQETFYETEEKKEDSKKIILTEHDIKFLQEKLNSCSNSCKSFVLPGSSVLEANLHLSRCFCRKLEIKIVRMRRNGMKIRDLILKYLNKLSKVIFVLSQEIKD